MDNKDVVIKTINLMLSSCNPIHYTEFNKFMSAVDEEQLLSYENKYPVIGVSKLANKWGITTLGIIATITDILCNERLQFHIDDSGHLKGVSWYDPSEDKNTDGQSNK